MRAHKVRRGAKVIRSGQMLKRAFEDAKHVADAELFGKGTVEKSDEVKPVCITLAILFNDGTTKKYVSIADDFEPEDDEDDEDFECCDECDDECDDDDDEDSCDSCPCCGACCTWEDESAEDDCCEDDDDDDESEESDSDCTHAEIDRLMKRLNELAGKMLAREKAKHHAGK